jgi:hypothetical protein
VVARGGSDRVQVGDATVGGLDGAERDERGGAVNGLGDVRKRHQHHIEIASEEWEQHAGEVLLCADHTGARPEGTRDEPRMAETWLPMATRSTGTPRRRA